MAFGIGLTPAQIARKDREYRSSQGSPFANSARSRNPHPPLSLTNKGRGHSISNVKMYKLQRQAFQPVIFLFSRGFFSFLFSRDLFSLGLGKGEDRPGSLSHAANPDRKLYWGRLSQAVDGGRDARSTGSDCQTSAPSDPCHLARVGRYRLEVVLAVSLQLFGLEAAFGVYRQNLLIAPVIRRCQIRD
jgi:hypothetical protein